MVIIIIIILLLLLLLLLLLYLIINVIIILIHLSNVLFLSTMIIMVIDQKYVLQHVYLLNAGRIDFRNLTCRLLFFIPAHINPTRIKQW